MEINRYIDNQRKHVAALKQRPLNQFRNIDGGEASWEDCGWVYTNSNGQQCYVYFVDFGGVKHPSIKSAKKAPLLREELGLLLMAFVYQHFKSNKTILGLRVEASAVRRWLSANDKNPACFTNEDLLKSLNDVHRPIQLSNFFKWLEQHKLMPNEFVIPSNFNKKDRLFGHDIIEHNKTKLPDDKALMALGAIIYDVIPIDREMWDTHSKTPQREQFVCAMSAQAIAAPNRIASEQTVLHIQNLKKHTQISKGKERTIYYLDWQGSKGYKNNQNHILAFMAPTVERTVDYTMLVTEPARVLARFYAKPELSLKRVLGNFKPSKENLRFLKPDMTKPTNIIHLGCLLGFFDNTQRLVRVTKETKGSYCPVAKRGSKTYTKSIRDLQQEDSLVLFEGCDYGFRLLGLGYTRESVKNIFNCNGKITLQDFQEAWVIYIKKQFPAFPIANNANSGRVDFRLAMFAFTGSQLFTGSPGYAFGSSHFSLVPISSLGPFFAGAIAKPRESNNFSNIFTNHGFSNEFSIKPHQFRHFLNDAADKNHVSHKIINMWSGRVSPDQLLHYTHRTNSEKALEISDIMFKDELTPQKAVEEVALRVRSQAEYMELTSSAAAVHSTGMCTQNLLLYPCDYLNDFITHCALCRSSCHIAHDDDAIALLSKDLQVQLRRLDEVSEHHKFSHSGGMQNWYKTHLQNTEMLRQLLMVLRDSAIKAGSWVRILKDKEEIRITDVEAKRVEKKTLSLPDLDEALRLALQSKTSEQKAERDRQISNLLTLIEG